MKTTRIVTLSLILGLAGAYSAAWGAESVMNLISSGEAILNEVQSAKDQQAAVDTKNKQLMAAGKQVSADQTQLQADIAAFTKDQETVKQNIADYKQKCEGKQLNQDEYKTCKASNDQIQADIARINAEPAKLKARQDDVIARANKYNSDIKGLQDEAKAAGNAYTNALTKEETWLDQARTLVATPAFQPFAQKASCPDVQKPPKTIDGVQKMSQDVLACLKRVSGTGG